MIMIKGELIPVKAIQDFEGHWYIVPIELFNEFTNDLHNDDLDDFNMKYGNYRTGGDLNNIQLYANDQDLTH